MNGVGRIRQKLLIFRWKKREGSNENQKEKMEVHDAGTLRKED
jgi:hypothetical protein